MDPPLSKDIKKLGSVTKDVLKGNIDAKALENDIGRVLGTFSYTFNVLSLSLQFTANLMGFYKETFRKHLCTCIFTWGGWDFCLSDSHAQLMMNSTW